MSDFNYLMPDPLHDYLVDATVREPPVLGELREATARRPDGSWSSPPEVGQLLAFLVEISGARTVLELGTFTGYGALWMALSLPADGRLVAIDVNEDAHVLARAHWEKAGVAGKIDLHVGEVRDCLPRLADSLRGKLDFAFIDADKPGYGAYYDACLDLLRPGGMMAFDNVLQRGSVANPGAHADSKHARTMRGFNDRVIGDDRVSVSLLPVGDGLLLVRKR